jgi:hypothetical protein
MQADCAFLRAVAARLCLSGMMQALGGLILQSPLLMTRNPFRHKWPYGLKTNFHGSTLIRRAALSHAAEMKMPNQAMQRTAGRLKANLYMNPTLSLQIKLALTSGR